MVNCMGSLAALPIDAWAIIFRHMDEGSLTAQFDILFNAGVFGSLNRLDTFWGIMSRIELVQPRDESPTFDTFPDISAYKDCRATLMEMGMSSEKATHVTAQAHGELDRAMYLLGWSA